MSSSIMPDENNQPIHLEWKGKVYVKRNELSEEKNHIEAYKIRHSYTNYDQLINSLELQRLEPLERSRTVAIIKYECTSQALQFRNGVIREQFLEDNNIQKVINYDDKKLSLTKRQLLMDEIINKKVAKIDNIYRIFLPTLFFILIIVIMSYEN